MVSAKNTNIFLCSCIFFVFILSGFAHGSAGSDSQLFKNGLESFQKNNYAAAIASFNKLLEAHPKTHFKDMALYYLARSHLKTGNRERAAHFTARLMREFPANYNRGTIDAELLKTLKSVPHDTDPAAAASSREHAADRKMGAVPDSKVTAKMKKERARLMAEKAEREKAAAEANRERAAAKKTRKEKIARERAEQERLAKEKAEAERLALREAEAERLAAEKAEQERRAEQDRLQIEKEQQERLARKREERARLATEKTEEERLLKSVAGTGSTPEAASASPGSGKAAGMVPDPIDTAKPASVDLSRISGKGISTFDCAISSDWRTGRAGARIAIPFTITNHGSASDRFNLESGFPSQFEARFAAENTPGAATGRTPPVAPGATYEGVLNLTIPGESIDGFRYAFPVLISAQGKQDASISREIRLIASAPLLRVVMKARKEMIAPGQLVTYTVTLLNAGSAPAVDLTLRLICPPSYRAVVFGGAEFRHAAGGLELDGLNVAPGEIRELNALFTASEETPNGEELLCRADLFNNQLKTKASFVSGRVIAEKR